MAVILGAEQIVLVCDDRSQNNGEQTFWRDLLVQHLPDGLDLGIALLIGSRMAKQVYTNVIRQCVGDVEQLPCVLCYLSELVITALIGAAHELIGKDILKIINNDDLAFSAAHDRTYYLPIIRNKDVSGFVRLMVEVGPSLRTEGEWLLHDLDQKRVGRIQVSHGGGLARTGLAQYHCAYAHLLSRSL